MSKKLPRKGRPSLGKKGKTPRFTMSLDDARRLRWQKAAAKAGVSLAQWIRDTLDAAAS